MALLRAASLSSTFSYVNGLVSLKASDEIVCDFFAATTAATTAGAGAALVAVWHGPGEKNGENNWLYLVCR